MSGDGSGPASRRAWPVRTPRLRPAYRGLSNKMVPKGGPACHQRYLVDRRSRIQAISVACGTRGAYDSTCAGVPEYEEIGGRSGRSASTISRGSCDAMPRRAAESLDYRATTAQWHADRAGPAPETREAGGQPGAAHVCARSVGRHGRDAKGDCDCRAFGVLERSSTWTSAGSAMGIGLESGADCSSPTARLSPR